MGYRDVLDPGRPPPLSEDLAQTPRRERPAARAQEQRFVSAPITFFDELLLSYCDIDRWRKRAYVIAKVMAELKDEKINASWDMLTRRLRKLVVEDRLVAAGAIIRMRVGEVRLPGPEAIRKLWLEQDRGSLNQGDP